MADYKFDNFPINLFKLIIVSTVLISVVRCDNDDDYCWNPDCNKLGDYINANILSTEDPCEDFYEYACGNFLKANPPPTPDSNWSVIELIMQKISMKIQSLLSTKIIPTESLVVKQSKQLFQACMNTTRIERNAMKTMLAKLNAIGGWPILYPPDMFDATRPWEEVHNYFLTMTGDGALFSIDVSKDYNDPNTNAIYIDQPPGAFGKFATIQSPRDILDYMKFVKDIVLIFVQATGYRVPVKQIDEDLRDVLRLRLLIQLTLNYGVSRPNPTYSTFTIEGLQGATPRSANPDDVTIDWLKIFQGTFKLISNANIHKDTTIIVREPTYLMNIMHKIIATPLRAIVNHIHLFFVEKHVQHMTERMRDLLHDIRTKMNGRALPRLPRWSVCLRDHPMQHVLSSMYIHWYFPQRKRSKVNDLINDIKETMKRRMERATWLDEPTKTAAIKKVDNIRNIIGAEEWYTHYDMRLEGYYSGQVVGRFYLENVLNYEQNEYKIELGYYTGESTRVSTNDYPILPNAYYSHKNFVVLNVGQLQPPFFHTKFPPVVNYPGLGTVIAHEISHGFDKGGRKYDYEGKRVNWWSNSSLTEYKRRSNCLVNQFNSYGYKELEHVEPYLRVKGKFTLEENFADLLGIMVAYESYKEKMKAPIKPSKIDKLRGFNDEKLFFLIYANTFCEYQNEWTFLDRTENDPHTSARLRVNGPLSNMPEFAQAFNCPKGSLLNRDDKCMIW